MIKKYEVKLCLTFLLFHQILHRRINVAIVAVLLFWVVGYVLSDDWFFNKIITANKISSPLDALNFVCDNTSFATEKPVQGLTPRYLLCERKNLYCDESAVLLATIVHELGYNTRLVDLANNDSTSRHTVLEIFESNNWITYDPIQRLRGASYHEIIEGYESKDWLKGTNNPKPYKTCKNVFNHRGIAPQYRPYPNTYNWFVQNNYFIKKAILWLRGIPG